MIYLVCVLVYLVDRLRPVFSKCYCVTMFCAAIAIFSSIPVLVSLAQPGLPVILVSGAAFIMKWSFISGVTVGILTYLVPSKGAQAAIFGLLVGKFTHESKYLKTFLNKLKEE